MTSDPRLIIGGPFGTHLSLSLPSHNGSTEGRRNQIALRQDYWSDEQRSIIGGSV